MSGFFRSFWLQLRGFRLFLGLCSVLLLASAFLDYRMLDSLMYPASEPILPTIETGSKVAIPPPAIDRGHPRYEFWDALSRLGRGEWYLIPTGAGLLLLWAARRLRLARQGREWRNFCWLMLAVLASTGVLVNLFKVLFGRARPREIYRTGEQGFFWFRMDSAYHAFPSGHTAVVMSAALVGGLVFPRLRLFFLVVAGLIALSRVLTYAHFPGDLAAGGLLAVCVVALWRRQFQSWSLDLPLVGGRTSQWL